MDPMLIKALAANMLAVLLRQQRDMRAEAIDAALLGSRGNRKAAARLAGVSRTTVYRHLRRERARRDDELAQA